MSTIESGMRLSLVALGLNVVLAVGKIATGILGSSNALIADGIESTADVCSSIIVWGGLRFSIKPADSNHPFGHGKAEPIASLIVALVLLGAAIFIARQSVHEIGTPHQQSPAWYTLLVLLLVIALKETLYRFVFQAARSLESTALKGEAWHHRSDALTSAAAFVGIAVALIGGRGFESADDWAALAACTIVAWNGLRLLRRALDEIMDASVAPEVVEQVRSLAAEVPGVVAVEKCRIRKLGLHLALDMHVVVDGDLTVRHGHHIAHLVKDRLLASPHRINDVTVHIEPNVDATPRSLGKL